MRQLTFVMLMGLGLIGLNACKPKAPATEQAPAAAVTKEPDQNAEIGKDARVSVAEIAKLVQAKDPATPKILQIGFPDFYKNARIPGAFFGGEGSSKAGRETLAKVVKDWKRDTNIAIYCGCCPWEHCPNVLPAYKKLKTLGFTNVKAIEIHEDFDQDWIAAKLPYESTPKKK